MRTGAAAGTAGYHHEAALYESDAQLLDVVVPFLLDGVAAGEPTLCTFAERNAELLRGAVGPDSGITFLPGADQYARPVSAIRDYQRTFGGYVAEGAEQIRVVGDVPHPGTGADWYHWVRYEAVVNRAYAPYPVWGMCPYDLRTAPDHVIADVIATHPNLVEPDGAHRPNPGCTDPFAVPVPAAAADPMAHLEPQRRLVDPTPADARRAARDLGAGAGLSAEQVDDLLVVVSELATNAIRHGGPPTVVELRAAPGRVLVTVRDQGPGPKDPFVGLVDAGHLRGGRGLWIVHQLCADVALRYHDDHFEVSAAVGTFG